MIGTAFERVFGPVRWLLAYFVLGLAGQVPGFFWNPYGTGNSVPVAVLLGMLFGFGMLWPRRHTRRLNREEAG